MLAMLDGYSALSTGRLQEAVLRFREAHAVLGGADVGGEEYETLIALTQVLAMTGDATAARATLEEARDRRHASLLFREPDLLLAHAWVEAAEGAVTEAARLARHAADVAAEQCQAQLSIDIRTYDSAIRTRVMSAVERIIRAEAAASGVVRDPEIDWYLSGPVLTSDPEATERTVAAFTERFGAQRADRRAPVTASEDAGHFGAELEVPTVYWYVGGTDPDRFAQAAAAGRLDQDVPFNQSPDSPPSRNQH